MNYIATSKKRQKYFPNLDGLRFIAFFMVFISHGFGCNEYFNIFSNNHFFSYLATHFLYIGGMGVEFFFVLSGFLITYLLICEKDENRDIKIKNFYIRRILRIWPIYFLVVFFGLATSRIGIFPPLGNVTSDNIGYLLLFMVNFMHVQNWLFTPILGILWSVSIEEQFYLVWPWFVKFFSRMTFPIIATMIFICSQLYKYKFADNPTLFHYHIFSALSFLTLGSLSAYLAFFSDRLINFFERLSRPKIIAAYLTGITVFFIFGFQAFFINYYYKVFQVSVSLFLGVFYCFVILEQSYGKYSFFKMKEFINITKLGKYTYALYSFHLIAIYLTVFVFKSIGLHNNNIANPFVYLIEFITSLMLAIFISMASYKYYEGYFLRLKSKFTVVK